MLLPRHWIAILIVTLSLSRLCATDVRGLQTHTREFAISIANFGAVFWTPAVMGVRKRPFRSVVAAFRTRPPRALSASESHPKTSGVDGATFYRRRSLAELLPRQRPFGVKLPAMSGSFSE